MVDKNSDGLVGMFPTKVIGTGNVRKSKTGRYLHQVLGLLGLPPGTAIRKDAKRYIVERFLGTFTNGTCTAMARKLYLHDLCTSYNVQLDSLTYKAIKSATLELVKHFKEGKSDEDC